jgi:hypothetical protein
MMTNSGASKGLVVRRQGDLEKSGRDDRPTGFRVSRTWYCGVARRRLTREPSAGTANGLRLETPINLGPRFVRQFLLPLAGLLVICPQTPFRLRVVAVL